MNRYGAIRPNCKLFVIIVQIVSKCTCRCRLSEDSAIDCVKKPGKNGKSSSPGTYCVHMILDSIDLADFMLYRNCAKAVLVPNGGIVEKRILTVSLIQWIYALCHSISPKKEEN